MKRSIYRPLHICIALVTAAAAAIAVQPAKSSASKKTPSKTASKTSSGKKKYVSSSGKATTSKKRTVVKQVTKKIIPAKPAVSAKVRAAAHDDVFQTVASRADLPVENAAALIPFFEQLYRHQRGEVAGPLRSLHYGD